MNQEVFVFPASFAQQRLWFLNKLAPENPFYNVSAGIRLSGQINLVALEQTFNEIVRRHESLRTTFAVEEGQLMQVIAPDVSLPLPVIDLQIIPAYERKGMAKQLAISEAQLPFNLTTGPLLRVKLLMLDETESILLLMLHHIVADGWSLGVLLRELGTLYTALSLGHKSPLPELPIQYADFACWQRQWLQGVVESQLSYWRQQLKQMPVLSLPSDRLRPPIPTYRGATQSFALSPPLTQALETLSQQEQASLFMTLLAAFQTLLYRYTGQTDIVVGSPIANRPRQELEGLIGFFINSLVLRTDLSGNPTFRELLTRVRDVAFGAYAHQDLPFEQLVQEVQERDLSRHPLFQIAIALQNTPIDALELPGLQLDRFEFDSGTARLDLELQLWQNPASLQGQMTYSTDLFEQTTIARMLGHFQTLVQGIVSNPNQRLAELPLLTKAEQQQLIEWNQTHQDYCHECFHHRFEAQVQLTPDAIAVVFEDEQLSYQALNARSNQLAHYLQTLGVRPEVLVGICVERSCEMIVALLGILKAGGAYVPFDPSYPQVRLEFMLEDSQVPLVVTQQQWRTKFTKQRVQAICLDGDAAALALQPQHNLSTQVSSTNLAYVIYTSGSTGKPKGVMIEHHGLSNLAHAQRQVFNLQSSDRIVQFASLSFDASIFEIVMALQVGATLYIVKQESRLGTALLKFLQKNAITTVTLPPTVLLGLPVAHLPALKTIISAGEACSSEIVARWASHGRRFFNAYGPTEATVWSTVAEIQDSSIKPLLGRAIANTQLYVLDADLQLVPVGIPGELHIGGDGLARGYLHRPELTAERFIPNPFVTQFTIHNSQFGNSRFPIPDSRFPVLYKTGDLVRYRLDGALEYIDRLDHQVKLRGFRVELGEIETVLSQHPAISESAAIAHKDSAGNQRLVAYIVFKLGQLTPIQLRHYLQEKLPEYLIPSAFVVLESLPLTPNGKIDRKALDSLYSPSVEQKNTIITPRTPTEERLAKLWAQVLNLEQIGVNDNFFAVGGDSLLAMQLIDRVQQQEQQEFPLANLFLAPTIAQLATLLDKSIPNTALDWSPLVPLQQAGIKRPFFCVHPIFGVVFPYYELAHQLGSDQPFYGLHPIGLTGKQPPHTQIEDMATAYLKAIQQVQPQGPYLLGGWSFGGLVAFEMAQQLQNTGQQVALLALFDTLAPVSQNKPSLGDNLKFLLKTAIMSTLPFILDYISLLTAPRQHQSDRHRNDSASSRGRFKFWQFQWAALVNLIPEVSRLKMLDELTILPLLRVFYANSQAAASYMPKAYANKITLFRTAQSFGNRQDLTLGWSQLSAAEVEIHQVPGNHLSMMRKPDVQTLAEQLRDCIEQVESDL